MQAYDDKSILRMNLVTVTIKKVYIVVLGMEVPKATRTRCRDSSMQEVGHKFTSHQPYQHSCLVCMTMFSHNVMNFRAVLSTCSASVCKLGIYMGMVVCRRHAV